MSKTIQLASGKITPSPDNRITIELLEVTGEPPIVRISWPARPTVTSAASLGAVVAVATRLLSNASLELARIQKTATANH